MELPRQIFRVLTVLAASLLVSCIDGREEIWFNANGSGRVDVSYSLPAAAATFHGGEAGVQKLIEGYLRNAPALASSSCEVVTAADRLKIRVRASFNSARELQQISNSDSPVKLPSSASHLAGEMTVKVDGRTVDFTRIIAAGHALPGALFLPAARYEGRNLTYIVHLPAPSTESNATSVSDGGRTLVWDYPLARALQGPVAIRFKTRMPIPDWAIALGIAAGIVVCLLVARKLFLRASSVV